MRDSLRPDPLAVKRKRLCDVMATSGKSPSLRDRDGVIACMPESVLDSLISYYSPTQGDSYMLSVSNGYGNSMSPEDPPRDVGQPSQESSLRLSSLPARETRLFSDLPVVTPGAISFSLAVAVDFRASSSLRVAEQRTGVRVSDITACSAG